MFKDYTNCVLHLKLITFNHSCNAAWLYLRRSSTLFFLPLYFWQQLFSYKKLGAINVFGRVEFLIKIFRLASHGTVRTSSYTILFGMSSHTCWTPTLISNFPTSRDAETSLHLVGNASSYDLCSDRRLIMLNSEMMLQQSQSSEVDRSLY